MNHSIGSAAAAAVLLIAAVTGVGAADAAVDRRMGNDAFAQGDYANAARFYTAALEADRDDPEAWAADALKLGAARLRSGDREGAQAMLTEFRRRFPARSAGLLPGELLLAENRLDDAEKFFSALTATATTAEEAAAARYTLGAIARQQQRYDDAIAAFQQLARQNADLPQWKQRALNAEIETMIAAGKLDEARNKFAALPQLPGQESAKLQLGAKLALSAGDLPGFLNYWKQLDHPENNHPAPELYELAVSAAAMAEKSGKNGTTEALALLRAAFRLAPDDAARRDVLRGLINLESQNSPLEAAANIDKYLKFFPNASDRAELLIRGARLMAAQKDAAGALAFYHRITDDQSLSHATRLTAAREAAATAAAAGLNEEAETNFNYLTRQAETPAQREEGHYLYGEYLFAQGKNADAAAEFIAAVKEEGSRVQQARFWLLQALLRQHKFAEALPVAEALSASTSAAHRAAAGYFRGVILENTGRREEARSSYRKFLLENPESEYVPAALFAAAELALALQDFAAATQEFFRFAERYPNRENTPTALYLAMQSAWFAGQAADIDRALELLDKEHPDSPAAIEARLQLAEFLRQTGDFEGAMRHLAVAEQRNGREKPEFNAELLLIRGRVLFSQRRYEEALRLFETILEQYAATPVAATAAWLAGNLQSDRGLYREALKHYTRARELRPTGSFAQLCDGRIADSRYSLYSDSLEKADLEAARDAYRNLAANAADPRIRLQSLYKLGKCLELEGNAAEALAAYERLLYLAADLKRQGVPPDPVWTGKAAYAAVVAHLKSETPAGAAKALGIIDRINELDLPNEEEFGPLRKRIVEKYNLQEN